MQIAVGERQVKRRISVELEGRILSLHARVLERAKAHKALREACKGARSELEIAQNDLSFALCEAEDGQTTLFKPEEEPDATD